MNIVIAILLCFALLGAADKMLGGKLGASFHDGRTGKLRVYIRKI